MWRLYRLYYARRRTEGISRVGHNQHNDRIRLIRSEFSST